MQLILGKRSYRKLFVLDSVVIILKYTCDHNNEKHLLIASTEKTVSNTCKSTLYSNKEGLRLPICSKFKELLGKRLSYLQ